MTSVINPALRAAIDASLSWYDALCALHGVPCGIEEDVWCAYSTPPPLHSAAKTVESSARPDRALAAVAAVGEGSIADSFGTFDLRSEGYELLFEAQWIHRAASSSDSRRLPVRWTAVRTSTELRDWTSRHDTESVLLSTLLERSAFRVIGRRSERGDGQFDAGAVLHLCTGVVDISNVWAVSDDVDWEELVAAAAAVFPGRDFVGYEQGSDLDKAKEAGFAALGPQRIWVR